jgi:DNA-binding IclR family transcriptional regulator
MNDKEIAFFKLIYPYLSENREIRNKKVVELSGKPSGTARHYLVKLVGLGVLTIKGENRNRTYRLVEQIKEFTKI